jgi:hypothetical protein
MRWFSLTHMVDDKSLIRRLDTLPLDNKEIELYRRLFSGFYPIEKEFCMRILEYTSQNHVVREHASLQPGAYTDIEHALLFPSKEHVFIDPAYNPRHDWLFARKHRVSGPQRIVDSLHKLGLEASLSSVDRLDVDGRIKIIRYAVNDDERRITLLAMDATTYEPVNDIGSFVLKKPCSIIDGKVPSLYELISEERRDANTHRLMKDGLYFEAGTTREMPEKVTERLKVRCSGEICCTVFYRDDDVSVYKGALWQKV